jgi:hypothetical protein
LGTNLRLCSQEAKCYQIPSGTHLVNLAHDSESRLSQLVETRVIEKPSQQAY